MKVEIEIKLPEGVELQATSLDTPAIALRKLRTRQQIVKSLEWQLDRAHLEEKRQREWLWGAVAEENETKAQIEEELKLLDSSATVAGLLP